jgi:hypothetical protein
MVENVHEARKGFIAAWMKTMQQGVIFGSDKFVDFV